MHFFLFASQLDSQYFDYFRSHDLTGNLQYRAQHFLCLSIGINKLGTLMDEIYWDFFIERRFLVMYLSNTSVISVLTKPKNNERINTFCTEYTFGPFFRYTILANNENHANIIYIIYYRINVNINPSSKLLSNVDTNDFISMRDFHFPGNWWSFRLI